ncbi:phosphate signaling complex PhoU family protein [Methanocaldococcus sp.]
MFKNLEYLMGKIDNRIVEISNKVKNQLNKSVDIYRSSNRELAKAHIIKNKNIIEELEDLEYYIIKVLCLYRPVSKDLRKLIVALKFVNLLDNINENTIKILNLLINSEFNFNREISYFKDMNHYINVMFNLAIKGYIKEDIGAVNELYNIHKKVEKIYYQDFQRYIARKIFENTLNIALANELTNVGKYLERCENGINSFRKDIYFLITGKKFLLGEYYA